jgi:hypothetical protein
MFIVPASKVLVAATKDKLLRVPERVMEPCEKLVFASAFLPTKPVDTQVFEFSRTKLNTPLTVVAAALVTAVPIPSVKVLVTTPVPNVLTIDVYPVVSKEPEPIRTLAAPAAAKLTPFNITVIRFTHDGMPVKSTLVPDAVTAVPDTIGANVPVTFTSVCVVLPATAGADTVIEPDVSPERTKEAIYVLLIVRA